jgi:hypothetical protein
MKGAPMLKAAYLAATCGLLVCLLLVLERPAYAYVDPGSSLFLFQGISSAFLGVFYFLRRRFKALAKAKDREANGELG